MSPLILFIIVIVAFTFIITRYAINGLNESVISPNRKKSLGPDNSNFWQNAETTNGRLAMMGLFALVINYGFFGWVIPGFF